MGLPISHSQYTQEVTPAMDLSQESLQVGTIKVSSSVLDNSYIRVSEWLGGDKLL